MLPPIRVDPSHLPLNPERTVAELKELRQLTDDQNDAQRVAILTQISAELSRIAELEHQSVMELERESDVRVRHAPLMPERSVPVRRPNES